MSPPRFIFYSHDDGLGADHLRRNLAIAAAVTDAVEGASVLVVTGGASPVAHGLAPNVDVLTLPAVRSLGNGHYSAQRLAMSGRELRELRTTQIETAVRTFRPDVMLVDTHPAGVREELRPALAALDAAGGHAALGLRDVLDEPLAGAETRFERPFVYGDRRAFDLAEQYGLAEALAARTRYCGFVVGSAAGAPPPFGSKAAGRPLVLATAGVGSHLLAGFVRAARGAAWDGVVATESQPSDADRHALRRSAVEAGVAFHAGTPDVSSWVGLVDALVCTGGYSTVAEAISRGTPTLCVSGTAEELTRARSLARLGLVRALEPERLDPAHLRDEVTRMLAGPRPAPSAELRFDGAHRAARELLELAAS
jgi:predicted glycosyltransferase